MTPTSPAFSVSPRDWPEDFAHDNGNYLCRCLICKETFHGYKRRHTCKVCATEIDKVSKERANWLHEHGAPKDWVVFTVEEVQKMHAEVANQTWDLVNERSLRQSLAAALAALTDCIQETRGRDAHVALAEAKAILGKSWQLDTDLAARQRAKESQAKSAAPISQ